MTSLLFVSPGGSSFVRCSPARAQTCQKTRWRAQGWHAAPVMVQTSERASKVVGGPYKGVYGEWTLTQGDVDGVLVYRSSLLVSAASVACAVAATHTGAGTGTLLDVLFGLHTAAFGVALATIHIYLRPMHNALKILYGAGVAGAVALLAAHAGGDAGLVQGVVQSPTLLLAVGWQFVALTGLFFKESICFGRVEALLLTALVPILTGGHFLGVIDKQLADSGLVVFAAMYLFFAIRKFAQLPQADLGDMSVFRHIAKNEGQ